MIQDLPWSRSLRIRLGGSTLLLLVVSALFALSNIYALKNLTSEIHTITQIGKYRPAYQLLYELSHWRSGETRAIEASRREIARLVEQTDQRLAEFAAEVENGTDVAANFSQRERLWREDIKPVLQRIAAAPADAEVDADIRRLDPLLRQYATLVETGLELREVTETERLRELQALQIIFSLFVLAVLLLVLWLTLNVVRRATALATTAEKIKEGDLDQTAPIKGSDELGLLGKSFNAMTQRLRGIIETEREGRTKLEELLSAIRETTNSLSSASAEILAGTTQQASGMHQQSAAVAETVTTVDEVLQTSEQAAERANAVSESSQRAAEVSRAGRQSTQETITAMIRVQERSASIAEGILSLAEHGQEIGEIIAAVTDIADQTNLLAVNASIEASRAGEHGKGFTIVASEIKDLAGQSKKATAQVRQILGEIQKATHSAVMAAEEGTKSIDQALRTVEEGDVTIRSLEEMITDAARAATQIAASASQQSTGMAQIHQAMAHIDEASSQNLAATRQTEQAARDLNELGVKLKELLASHEQ